MSLQSMIRQTFDLWRQIQYFLKEGGGGGGWYLNQVAESMEKVHKIALRIGTCGKLKCLLMKYYKPYY